MFYEIERYCDGGYNSKIMIKGRTLLLISLKGRSLPGTVTWGIATRDKVTANWSCKEFMCDTQGGVG